LRRTSASVQRTTPVVIAVGSWLAIVADIVGEAVPHGRGLGFVPQLRYALLTPACWIIAVGAAFLYRSVSLRSDNPRRIHAALLSLLALISVLFVRLVGPQGISTPHSAVTICGAIILAWLTPRFIDRPLRLVCIICVDIFGVLEGVGQSRASTTDRAATPPHLTVPESVFGAEPKFIDLPSGARIHYADVGTGPNPSLSAWHSCPVVSVERPCQWPAWIVPVHCCRLPWLRLLISSSRIWLHTPRTKQDVRGVCQSSRTARHHSGDAGLGWSNRYRTCTASPRAHSWPDSGKYLVRPASTKETRGKFSVIAG
jgi:hypothetical protein